MAGQWKIELVPEEGSANGGGSGSALWWEDSTTVDTQERDYAYNATGLERTNTARNEFLADAVIARDKWQTYQTKIGVADTLALAWATIINTNDSEAVP